MRSKSILLLLAMLAGSIGIAWGPAAVASACSCAISTPTENASRAVLVAEGVVGAVDAPADPTSSTDPRIFAVALERVWKGEAARTIEVTTPNNSASCGLDNVTEGMRIIVFATHTDVMGEPIEGWGSILCDGTGPVDETVTAELTTALGEPRAPAPDAQVDPAPQGGGEDGKGETIGGEWLAFGLGAAGLVALAAVGIVLVTVRRRRAG